MSAGQAIALLLVTFFCIYGFAAALSRVGHYLFFPKHQRIWAVIPLRGRIDNPETLLNPIAVSRLYEQGFHEIVFVDIGIDRESKARCDRLSQSGEFPMIYTMDEFAELLQFPSK